MNLTAEERSWLQGEAGPAIQRAAEIVIALGQIYGAERLIPVASVQISGVSYRNIGAAGLRFLRRWAEEGARVRVPTTLNPTGMDLEQWQELGFQPDFAARQLEVVETFAAMGVGQGHPVPTCTPYAIGNLPHPGESIAWAESSAVAYANSVLGARTNREGGPGAIAAAILGRTAAYGLHLEAHRRATLHVTVTARPAGLSDYSALGARVGKIAGSRVPWFTGLPLDPADPLTTEKLKALGAAMAATGAVALFHVEKITPEAQDFTLLAPDAEAISIADLQPGYTDLNDPAAGLDLVWLGCPHASAEDLARIAARIAGEKVCRPLWITTARPLREAAARDGTLALLEAAGARVIADACVAIAPIRDLGYQAVATNSAKGAYYLRNLAGVGAHFGTLEQCIAAALTGCWETE
jgi:predicted aconitase